MAISPRMPDNVVSPLQYETVAAGQTAQVLGGNGRLGDYLKRLILVPAVAAAGAVDLIDNATTISIYAGGAVTALPNLQPMVVDIDAKSASGAWKITTGANISVIAVGDFSG